MPHAALPVSQAQNPFPNRIIDAYPREYKSPPVYDLTFFRELARIRNKEPMQEGDEVMTGMLTRWFNPFVRGGHEFLRNGVRRLDGRTSFMYIATGVTPAIAAKMVGAGLQYASNALDSMGECLDGCKNYKLHLPPNIPAKNFWSLVVYDPQTRSELRTDAQFPNLNSQTGTVSGNSDRSHDIYIGPKAPADGVQGEVAPVRGQSDQPLHGGGRSQAGRLQESSWASPQRCAPPVKRVE